MWFTLIHLYYLYTMSSISEVSASEKKKKCPFGDCKYRMKPSDTIIICRCGTSFCPSHRLPEMHACAYNYRAAAINHLSSQLVKCNGDRMIDKL